MQLVRGAFVLALLWVSTTGNCGPRGETVSISNFRLTHWTTEDGLPQNTISALLQTKEGYLWVGTRYGLARYDGVRFADFTAELSGSDPQDLNVLALAQDREGQVWVLTPSGFAIYSLGRIQHLRQITNAPTERLYYMHASGAGGLWAAGETQLFHFRNRVCDQVFDVPQDLGVSDGAAYKIDDFFEHSDGTLWIRTRLGPNPVWWNWDPRTRTTLSLERYVKTELGPVGGLWTDPQGALWIAAPEKLWCWRDGNWERFGPVPWGTNEVYDLVRDVVGSLWATTAGSNQLHRCTSGQFTTFGPDEGLHASYDVRAVLPDREGNLWTGTGRHGLFRVQPRKLVTLLDHDAATVDEVYSVAPGGGGRVWLGTTHGLVKYEAGRAVIFTNSVYTVAPKRVRPAFETSAGEVLFNVDFDGLHTLSEGAFQRLPFLEPMPPPGERRLYNSFAEDAQGNVWMATARGLARLKDGVFRLWTTKEGLHDNRTFGLACGLDGGVWVGSVKAGVQRFKDGQFKSYSTNEGLLSNEAWPLRVEPDGTVWVGTPLGLNRIRGERICSVTMREGLFDNLAYCLLADRHTNYWAFGNRGIWRLSKRELHAAADGKLNQIHCVTYGESDGMLSAEGNGDQQPNAAAMPDGKLWFPTTRGVVVLDPDDLRENHVPPPVAVEEVRANGDLVFRDGGILPSHQSYSAASPLLLRPGHARVLEIRYTATTFIDSEKTHFRFRLRGSDTVWREADTRRVAYFTNLRPGKYNFVVEARNHHGYWSDHPAHFQFVVTPYFYQTWLFYLISGCLMAALLGTLHVRRLSARSRRLQLHQERALITERDRISRDLHDDLGSSLTGIALGIEVTRQKLKEPEELESRLASAAEALRQLVTRLRDVVWSLNPRCDTLDSFCAYLTDHAETFLPQAGLQCRWELPDEIPHLALSAEVRYHLLLITKEALTNVVKHAQATEVRVSLIIDRTQITLSVADNGRGFPDTSAGAFGNGLRNMSQRAIALHGSCTLTSVVGGGTKVTLHFPRPTPSPSSAL